MTRMTRKRRGFTLIELLVVIAIIGILAGMVFPVFAWARESARKAVCLSNVKNIALAVQMYLGDNNDTFPPVETRAEVLDNLGTVPLWCEKAGRWINPYLRWPVIFDEYTKNRDIWRCPSARYNSGPMNIWGNVGSKGWFEHLQDYNGQWGSMDNPSMVWACNLAYPPGWGGIVTDTLIQGRFAAAGENAYGSTGGGATEITIACTEEELSGMKLVEMENPTNWIVAGDCFMAVTLAGYYQSVYDICAWKYGCADYDGCPWSQDCGLAGDDWEAFKNEPNVRKSYTRHLGGANFGFADGHAKWWNAQLLQTKLRPMADMNVVDGNGCPVKFPEEPDSIYGFSSDPSYYCTVESHWTP
jgi:prepilin-type N-terminal cleavage/methylation domain-containing protein/prepilin-type processing-associated H-X9-DG protein